MHHVWVGLVIAAWVRISSTIVISRPDWAHFPDLNATEMESAFEDTSPLNMSLGVPLVPSMNLGFWSKSTGTDTQAGPFNEASLVACIVSMISQLSWTALPDIPIPTPKMERRCANILFTIKPSLLPGADFTRYKTGIALITLLWTMFKRGQFWSCGHITVEIHRYDPAKTPRPWGLPIGIIYVEKIAPEVGTMMNSTASRDNGDDLVPLISSKRDISNPSGGVKNRNSSINDESLLLLADDAAKKTRQMKWLGTYASLMRFMFAKAWNSRVALTLPRTTHISPQVPVGSHWRSDFDPEMEANVTFVHDPGPMLWDRVVSAAMQLCELAMAKDRWDYTETIWVPQQGLRTLRLSIGPTWRPR